jgi:hypothetical protein
MKEHVVTKGVKCLKIWNDSCRKVPNKGYGGALSKLMNIQLPVDGGDGKTEYSGKYNNKMEDA